MEEDDDVPGSKRRRTSDAADGLCFSSSDEGGNISDQPARNNSSGSKRVEIDMLVKQWCRCAVGRCFTQFATMKDSIVAKRNEFRSLDPLQQALYEYG